MSELNLLPDPEYTYAPDTFARGQTLAFKMDLPATATPGAFQPYTPKAQLRRYQNDGPDGFIADLTVEWDPDEVALGNYTVLRFTATGTEAWPLGPAEFDVLFEKDPTSELPGALLVRSKPVYFEIVPGRTPKTGAV